MTEIDLAGIDAERERIRATYLQPADSRPVSSARGLHHFAVVARDVEETVRFYQELLEFPLTEIFENRDYPGSNHFFFDLGHGNLLAFFDFPGLDVGPYAEVLGGLHHIAISVEPESCQTPSASCRMARSLVRAGPWHACTRRGRWS
jgi:catechol 2,3-dioxygenase-like lactoylglutathione lyase family enzyme